MFTYSSETTDKWQAKRSWRLPRKLLFYEKLEKYCLYKKYKVITWKYNLAGKSEMFRKKTLSRLYNEAKNLKCLEKTDPQRHLKPHCDHVNVPMPSS